ncbi:hypothetical protein [Nocardioides coralli]|uniref:hypothetical protein n=1 Tax=Nocardioides coralli TaxID=2872154 RepID=UPI001CA3B3CD|nr:hypothetical protein [Nocardioides coralli]QZY29042.1 hypothetical protein K6T13_16675 [Nocardioides coralli]
MSQQRDDRPSGDQEDEGQVSEVGRLDETVAGGADATDKTTGIAPDQSEPEGDDTDD